MGIINILPKNLADKIAAGEVVERPASVVKELVENSLDAASRRIDIIIENAGQSLITVIDDGEGIGSDDLPKACQRHATSKIIKDEDLDGIATLGFRGEALASIAAVSRMRVVSCRPPEPRAMRLEIEGGEVKGMFEAARTSGTTVEVRNLFFNTPARLKFLKSKATEMSQITRTVMDLALAYPEVSFRLEHNKEEIFFLDPCQDVLERIKTLLGKELAETLIPIAFDMAGVRIKGFISRAGQGQSSKKNQYIFVNRRPVTDKTIAHAIMQGYHTFMMEKQSPAALLFITTPLKMVDVNVHPNKREVRFRDAGVLHDVLVKTVRDSLQAKEHLPEFETKERSPGFSGTGLGYPGSAGQRGSYSPEFFSAELFSSGTADSGPESFSRQTNEDSHYLQAGDAYIIVPGKDGIIIIDQHAAHERVLFDELLAQLGQKKVEKQKLLLPVTVPVNKEQKTLLEGYKKNFHELGFELDDFGPETIAVHSYPAVLGKFDIRREFDSIIAQISSLEIEPGKSIEATRVLASIACHCAVRSGKKMPAKEMESLLSRLWNTSAPYTCPHGRPTLITIDWNELEKRFKRK